jgi:hypothetical protein
MIIRSLLLVGLSLSISGCTFLPTPLSYMNYARTGFDVKQIISDEPTLTDKVLSEATDMECRLFNAIYGKDICIESLEK